MSVLVCLQLLRTMGVFVVCLLTFITDQSQILCSCAEEENGTHGFSLSITFYRVERVSNEEATVPILPLILNISI